MLMLMIMLDYLVPLQPVRWVTSSQSQDLFPARRVPPTAEPARRGRECVNVAAAFTEQPMMPTPLPAQVSTVCLFVCLFSPGFVGGAHGASVGSFVI